MVVFIATLNCIFIFFLAWRWRPVGNLTFHKIYWPALLLKLSAGLLLGYVYSYQYSDSDTVRFFDSSIELSHLARTDFPAYVTYLWAETDAPYSGENRTLFFVKLVSLFSLITFDNYWIVSLYFSFLSFLGAWWLVRAVNKDFPQITYPMIFAFLIFPSCVFWSSGVIKETMAMIGLYFLSGIYVQIWMRNRISYFQGALAIVSLWILWNLKYYYAAVFISVALTGLLTRWFAENRMKPLSRSFYRECVLFIVLLMVMLFIVTFVHPNFYPQRIMEVIVENYYAFLQASHPDKVIHFKNLQPTPGSIVLNMPWAFLSGLFRPFIWEAANPFQVLVSLENLALFILVILSFQNIRHMLKSKERLLIFSIFVYCFMLCVFLTLSTPNFGTLVRYKIGFMPYFVLLISDQSVFIKWMSKLFNS